MGLANWLKKLVGIRQDEQRGSVTDGDAPEKPGTAPSSASKGNPAQEDIPTVGESASSTVTGSHEPAVKVTETPNPPDEAERSVSAKPETNAPAEPEAVTPAVAGMPTGAVEKTEPGTTGHTYNPRMTATLQRIFKKIEAVYPEHKIFAFSALMDDTRESLAGIAKSVGLPGYEALLLEHGYTIISREETRALRPTVLYMPGDEPECMKNRVQNVLALLAEYYPDRVIKKPIEQEHKSLCGKLTGLYQWFGYSDLRTFLDAYGYTYQRPVRDKREEYDRTIALLLERYSSRGKAKNITRICEENPDIANDIRNIAAASQDVYGMTFATYLRSVGLLNEKGKDAAHPSTPFLPAKLNKILKQYIGTDTEVIIPQSVTEISPDAFRGTAIERISFEKGSCLETIRDGAFADCVSLTCVDFTNVSGMVRIDRDVFRNCASLCSILGADKIGSVGTGTFEGVVGAFIRDGAYLYPQPWLYALLVRSGLVDPLEPVDITLKKVPCVWLAHAFLNLSEPVKYCNATSVPFAARAGYSHFVKGIITADYNCDACTTSAFLKGEYPVWTMFDLPDEESVRCFLAQCSIGNTAKKFREPSSDEYREKQRASFALFSRYVGQRRALGRGLQDYAWDAPLTENAKKIVLLNGSDGLWYRCNCAWDVKVGDLVVLSPGVKKCDVLASVRDVMDNEILPDHREFPIKAAYAQTGESGVLFDKAMAVASFERIYRGKTEAAAKKKKLNAAVKVRFESGKTYQYNCTLPAAVGDQVRVGGKLNDQVGTIVEIMAGKNRSSYMQDVLEVLESDEPKITATSMEWTFGVEEADYQRLSPTRNPRNKMSVQIWFDCGKTLTYNTRLYLALGDPVCVEGKFKEEIGTLVAFEGSWNSDWNMKEVRYLYEGPQDRLLYVEYPIEACDGYPFGYPDSNRMVYLINRARRDDQDAARQLVEIYSDEESKYYSEKKAAYWRGKVTEQ